MKLEPNEAIACKISPATGVSQKSVVFYFFWWLLPENRVLIYINIRIHGLSF